MDTTLLEEMGIEALDLETIASAIGLSDEQTAEITGTVEGGIGAVQNTTDQLLAAVNLNTLGYEIDRVLGQYGLQLRQGDVYLSRLAAERLGASAGDVVEVYVGPLPVRFRVRAVVEQAGPLSAVVPVVMLPLDEAQQLLFMNDKVNAVLVSNLGDELSGLEHSSDVTERLSMLAMDPNAVDAIASVLTRPDVAPLLRDAAPELLAVPPMEDEEDMPEFVRSLFETIGESLGIQPATEEEVATLLSVLDGDPDVDPRTALMNTSIRTWLLDQELPTDAKADLSTAMKGLNEFDVVVPLNKSTIVTAATVGGTVFSSVFSLFGALSILAAILLIFLIFVMLAAERRSEIGMARAIGTQRRQVVQMFVTEGMVYALVASAPGRADRHRRHVRHDALHRRPVQQHQRPVERAGHRPVRHLLRHQLAVGRHLLLPGRRADIRRHRGRVLPRQPHEHRQRHPRPARPRRHPLAARAARRVALGLARACGRRRHCTARLRHAGRSVWRRASGADASAPGRHVARGPRAGAHECAPYDRRAHCLLDHRPRPAGAVGAAVGTLAATRSRRTCSSTGRSSCRLSFCPGPSSSSSARSWSSWSTPTPLAGLPAAPWASSPGLRPVLKTAIAYPLNTRFRTGMTMVLFAMIMASVVVMAVVINAAQTLVTLDEQSTAGFDVEVSPTLLSFFSPVDDFEATLAAQADADVLADVEEAGVVYQDVVRARAARAASGPGAGSGRWMYAGINGVNAGYARQAANVYPLQARAAGYESDEAVWQAIEAGEDVAVILPRKLDGERRSFDDASARIRRRRGRLRSRKPR